MSLSDRLRRLGGKLGIIRVVDASAPGSGTTPRKVPTRTITLAELSTEIQAQPIRAPSDAPVELDVAFAQVATAAGVPAPAHGWTVDKLRDLLRGPIYRTLDRPVAQKALLQALAGDKATVEDLVKDALARDRAVDAYATFAQKKLEDRQTRRRQQMTDLEARIRQCQEEIARLKEEAKADKERWKQWRARKQAYEKDMAWALGYLIEKPVISVDELPEAKSECPADA